MSVCTSSPRKRLFIEPESARSSATLSAPNYSGKILTGLHFLRTQDVLCDYTLKAEDQCLKVHRAVMVACSDYFRAMLTGPMKESHLDSVELLGITAVGLQAVVNFVYSGSLELSLENLHDVLAALIHLQISEATDLCCQYMELAITVENCVDILNLTEIYTLTDSKAKAWAYILEHFEALAGSEQYYKLSHNQLASLLEENSLKVVSEYRLFELVLKWVNFSRPDREQYMPELMSNLRLPLLSGEELVDKVSRVDLMRMNKACSDLLTEAKDYHIVVSKQPLLQNSRTPVRSNKKSLIMCHAENLECYDIGTGRHAFLKDATVPLYNPCVCVVDNFMYACGGKYDSNENNEIATARCFRYDPRFDSWYELASMNEARKDFVMVSHSNLLYAIAGQDENMVMCTVECFSIAKNDWEVRSSLSHAVYGHAGALCGEVIYISGGQKFDGYCNKFMSYNMSKDTWVEETPLLQSRSNHIMAEIKGALYVLGGNVEDNYAFPVPITSVERYVPATGTWTLCSCTINIREAGACVLDDKIFIVGGINGQHYYSDLIQCYDSKTDDVVVIERFPTRIYGRACCIMTLPQYI